MGPVAPATRSAYIPLQESDMEDKPAGRGNPGKQTAWRN